MIWKFTHGKETWEYKVENNEVYLKGNSKWLQTLWRTIDQAVDWSLSTGATMEILHAPIIFEEPPKYKLSYKWTEDKGKAVVPDNENTPITPFHIINPPVHDKKIPVFSGKCCPTPFPAYKAGKYYCETCGVEDKAKNDQLDLFDLYHPPSKSAKTSGRCTCGSTAVGSDRHSDYCDLYRKR